MIGPALCAVGVVVEPAVTREAVLEREVAPAPRPVPGPLQEAARCPAGFQAAIEEGAATAVAHPRQESRAREGRSQFPEER